MKEKEVASPLERGLRGVLTKVRKFRGERMSYEF